MLTIITTCDNQNNNDNLWSIAASGPVCPARSANDSSSISHHTQAVLTGLKTIFCLAYGFKGPTSKQERGRGEGSDRARGATIFGLKVTLQ